MLGGPPTAVAAAEASLFDPDDRVRDAAIRALGAVADDAALAAIPGLPDLARDPSPAVRAAMACLYGSRGPDPSSERLIAELLEDPDSEARVAGLAAVRRLRDTASIDATRALLGDPSPRVRVAVVEALAAFPDRADSVPAIVAALDDDAAPVRRAAAAALAGLETTPDGVTDVLLHGSPRAQEAALLALRGHGPDVRETVIGWTIDGLERAARLRRARTVLAGAEPDATMRAQPTLALPVRRPRQPRAAGRGPDAPRAGGPGAPEAGGVIRRCLRSDDPEIRAQAIEALDSTGDRRLSGALVRLLEDEVGRRAGSRCRACARCSMMTIRGSCA